MVGFWGLVFCYALEYVFSDKLSRFGRSLKKWEGHLSRFMKKRRRCYILMKNIRRFYENIVEQILYRGVWN